MYSGSTATTSSSSVKGAAGKTQQKGRRNRSAAAVERRTLKGIAKRFEHNLKTENTKAEQEVPFFGNNPNPARASQYYQAQSEASCSTSGHSTYATFLAPHARLKRPLEPPREEGDNSVYSRVWAKFQRELPLVAAEVEKTPGKSARKSYLCEEARRAVTATLGQQRKEESDSHSEAEGLEPDTDTSSRRHQPGAVTQCDQKSRPATTRYSSSRAPTTRYSSTQSSTSSVTTRVDTEPPTVGYNSEVATPTWYQHDTTRRQRSKK